MDRLREGRDIEVEPDPDQEEGHQQLGSTAGEIEHALAGGFGKGHPR